MPPTTKKLEGHIASVRLFVHSSFRLSRFLMHGITIATCMLLF